MIDFIRKGKNTSDATATANDIISPKTAYVDNEKITGNIGTTPLQSSLVIVNEQKSINATTNNILDYFNLENEEFVISSSLQTSINNIVVQNSVIQKTININEIKSDCTLICARLFDLNEVGEIGIIVMLRDSSGKVFFSIVALNKNNLQINNVYTYETEDNIGNYATYGNIVYNKINNVFAMLIKWSNGQDRIYIIRCEKNNIEKISPTMPVNSVQNDVNFVKPGAAKENHQICLVVTGGYMMGRIYPVENSEITIGRSPTAGIPYKVESVSKLHCKVYRDSSNRWMLMDCNSRNGTYLKRIGKLSPMQPVEVFPGDIFFLGSPQYSFEIRG